MIALSELNKQNFPTTPEIDANLGELCDKLNQVRAAYAIPMIIASGLRSADHQLQVYNTINTQRVAQGLGQISAPMGSMHLIGRAADVQDLDGKLWDWCINQNMPLMESIGIWFEAKSYTPTWVHMQISPPKSGNRIFIPY